MSAGRSMVEVCFTLTEDEEAKCRRICALADLDSDIKDPTEEQLLKVTDEEVAELAMNLGLWKLRGGYEAASY